MNATFFKMNCLFVIGIFVALNCKVDAKVPGPVIVQLHHVVKLLNDWMKENRAQVDVEEFTNRMHVLGLHVSHILSLIPPRAGDFYLWQLNIMANQIGIYYLKRLDNEIHISQCHTKGRVIHWINGLIEFLQMIQDRLNAKISRFQNLKKIIVRYAPDERLIKQVIPAELYKLGLCIEKRMGSGASSSSGNELQVDVSLYHPKNLYLNDIVSWPSNRYLISDSHLVNWNRKIFQKTLTDKYLDAVNEFGTLTDEYTQLKIFREFVFVGTIIASVIGHLDVHFTAYQLHAQNKEVMNEENVCVWTDVLGVVKEFIEFLPLEYENCVLKDIYQYLIQFPAVDDPVTLSTVCENAIELIHDHITNQSVPNAAASSYADPLTRHNLLMDIVKHYPKQYMGIASNNYQQLLIYLNNLKTLFVNVNSSALMRYLNM